MRQITAAERATALLIEQIANLPEERAEHVRLELRDAEPALILDELSPEDRALIDHLEFWIAEDPEGAIQTIARLVLLGELTNVQYRSLRSFPLGRQALEFGEQVATEQLKVLAKIKRALRFDCHERRLKRLKLVPPRRFFFGSYRRQKRRHQRRSAQKNAGRGGDPPGDGPGQRRLDPHLAALDRDLDRESSRNIIALEGIGNAGELPMIGEPWLGDITALEPLTLLLRQSRKAPWRAVGISVAHARWLDTLGEA